MGLSTRLARLEEERQGSQYKGGNHRHAQSSSIASIRGVVAVKEGIVLGVNIALSTDSTAVQLASLSGTASREGVTTDPLGQSLLASSRVTVRNHVGVVDGGDVGGTGDGQVDSTGLVAVIDGDVVTTARLAEVHAVNDRARLGWLTNRSTRCDDLDGGTGEPAAASGSVGDDASLEDAAGASHGRHGQLSSIGADSWGSDGAEGNGEVEGGVGLVSVHTELSSAGAITSNDLPGDSDSRAGSPDSRRGGGLRTASALALCAGRGVPSLGN